MTITQSKAGTVFPWLSAAHPDLATRPLWWTVKIPGNTCFAVETWTSRFVAEWFARQAGPGSVVRGFVLGDRGERIYLDTLGVAESRPMANGVMELNLGGDESGAEPRVAVRIADE